jgi:hypothetical protein
VCIPSLLWSLDYEQCKVCMPIHERHFPMTAIYEKHPSPPAFSRLQTLALAEIYISAKADFVGGGHCPS